MLAIIDNVDISPYINTKTYSVNSEKIYTSFENANYVETRIPIRKKVIGSFELALYGKNGMDYATFLNNLNSAVDNDVLTIGLFVQNDNQFEAIEAYYKLTGIRHVELINGNYLDRVTIEIEER